MGTPCRFDREARDEREALRNDIARTIHDGPNAVMELATMMMAPHSWEACPHKATYLGDADALIAAGYRKVCPHCGHALSPDCDCEEP